MEDVKRPWEKLVDLMEADQPEQVRDYLQSMNTEDIVLSISRLEKKEQLLLLTLSISRRCRGTTR